MHISVTHLVMQLPRQATIYSQIDNRTCALVNAYHPLIHRDEPLCETVSHHIRMLC